jgi:tRNA (adenine57-N1/adenine58-N1)-methyltransferase
MTKVAQSGDLVMLLSSEHKRFVVRLQEGVAFHTHRGRIDHDQIIGQTLGRAVHSHLGHRFVVLPASTEDLMMTVQRATQIVYPKDIGYILVKLDVRSGTRIIEAGSGSGALTVALARHVRPEGHVYSYEVRPEMCELARSNVDMAGLSEWVTFHCGDVGQGFEEAEVDAVFLDVREPWHYLDMVMAALRPGGFFGTIVPTTNQISTLLSLMPRNLADVEVAEVLLRLYKPVPFRLRPMDRLTAHTGYILCARLVVEDRGRGPEYA